MIPRADLAAAVRRLFWGYLFLLLDFNLNLDGVFTLPLLANCVGWWLVWKTVLDLAPWRPSLGLLSPFCAGLGLYNLTQFVPALQALLPGWLGLLVAVVSLYTHFQLFTDLAALTGEEPAAAHLAPGLLTIRTVLVVCQTALYCTDLFLRLPWLAVCVWLLDLAAAVAALVHLGKLRRALAAPPQAPAL